MDTNDLEIFALVLVVKSPEIGESVLAVDAPKRPELDHDNLPFEII
jgi:hypothetical protein